MKQILYISALVFLADWLPAGGQVAGWASLNGGTTGGAGGDTLFVDSREALMGLLDREGPAVILVADTIDLIGGERLKITGDNLSIEGKDNRAMIRNGGLMILGSNVIVRNLSIGDSYINGHWDGKGSPATDCLTLYGTNIWVDHCNLFHAYDGLLDITGRNGRAADYITVSWTRFSRHNKTMLIGSSDRQTYARGHLRVTVHHCWFDGDAVFSDETDGKTYRLTQRLPRVRFGEVHLYNNYYEETASYCIAARFESSVVAEDNYFRNLEDPFIIEDRGMGQRDPSLVARGNRFEHVKGRRDTSGTAFEPGGIYDYHPDPAADVPTVVMNGAGTFRRKVNRNPQAVADYLAIGRKKTVLYPLENDSDPDGDPIRISAIVNVPSGRTLIYPDHLVYYRPDGVTADTVIYEIIDYNGGVSKARFVLDPGTP